MQQISLQLANPSNQPLNISISGAVPPTFEPSANDIRVNVLWFASLTFSLMTASFAILVKQWLREYLAVEYPSPQARLRIRHHRYPELLRWKVFEIAALLPLLQQLALALFFIGLCYFTASVHESVGHTTLPLVAGWAFCFTVATLLPVFLPRCPYKTTLLKSLHVYILRGLEQILPRITPRLPRPSYHQRVIDLLRRRTKQLLDRLRLYIGKYRSRHDEQYIIMQDDQDIKILSSVDVIQLNDELLSTTILESLQQIHGPRWIDIVAFVYELLNHRGYPVVSPRNFSTIPPLHFRTLSQSAYTGIIDIISRYAQLRLGVEEGYSAQIAIQHTWVILLSESRYPFPKSGVSALQKLFESPTIEDEWRNLVHASSDLSSLFGCLERRIENLDLSLSSSLRFIEALLKSVFRTDDRLSLSDDISRWPWDVFL